MRCFIVFPGYICLKEYLSHHQAVSSAKHQARPSSDRQTANASESLKRTHTPPKLLFADYCNPKRGFHSGFYRDATAKKWSLQRNMRPETPRGRAPPRAEGPCPTFGTTSALPGPMESMEFVVTSFELGELKGGWTLEFSPRLLT